MTPYPEIDTVLGELLRGARGVLGERFVGLYIGGSLATGDFDPAHSDIDFLVVTDGEVDDATLGGLQAVHWWVAGRTGPWARRLEGSYMAREAVRRYDPALAVHPHLSMGEDSLRVEPHGSEWVIQRHILREHGVALAGPPPATLIDPVSPGDLRLAVEDLFRGWWAPMLANQALLQDSGYRVYAVHTMCRILYTLRHGTIVSKPVAARWAAESLDQRWVPIIEWAQADAEPAPTAATGDLAEVLEFIRYTRKQMRGDAGQDPQGSVSTSSSR